MRKGVATGMAGMAVAYSVQQSKRADAWTNNGYVLFSRISQKQYYLATTRTRQLASPAVSSSCPSGSSWAVAMTSTCARRRAPPSPLPTNPTRWLTCLSITHSLPIPCAPTLVSGISTRTRRPRWVSLLPIASRRALTTRVSSNGACSKIKTFFRPSQHQNCRRRRR